MIGDNITYKPVIGVWVIILMTIIYALFLTIMIIITRDLVLLPFVLGLVFLSYCSYVLAKNTHTEWIFTDAGITVRGKGKDVVFYSWEDLPYARYETPSYRRTYLVLSSKESSDDEKKRILRLKLTYPVGKNGVFIFEPESPIRNTREVVELIEKRYGLKNRY